MKEVKILKNKYGFTEIDVANESFGLGLGNKKALIVMKWSNDFINKEMLMNLITDNLDKGLIKFDLIRKENHE